MKPLINILQEEANAVHNIGMMINNFNLMILINSIFLITLIYICMFIDAGKTDSKIFETTITPITCDSEIEINDSGHWLDSMLDSDE